MVRQDVHLPEYGSFIPRSPGKNFLNRVDSSQSSDLQHVARRLQQMQALNRLCSQLSDRVTAYLSSNAETAAELAGAEAELVQIMATGLSEVLDDTWVAIAHCPLEGERVGSDPGNAVFMLHAIASDPLDQATRAEAARSSIGWHLPPEKTLWLTPGKPIDLSQIHTLHSFYPGYVRPVLTRQTGIVWLLVYPNTLTTSGDREGDEARADDLELIGQFVSRCVAASDQLHLAYAQRQQAIALLARNHELEQTNRLKSEFLANTSHEIRTPLSSILGFTHLLQQQGYNSANLRHQEYLKIILTSGQHLLALINDILDLSKIEANQLSLQWEVIDVSEVCNMAIMLVRERASDRGLRIHLDISSLVTTIAVDGLRLKQMLFNLLSNAVKFTVQGSIGLQVLPVEDCLHFTVWDTGTGISQEQRTLLFKPYSQVANTVVGRSEGTGLGLVLTQKLAELHGGTVQVSSELGQGSRFTVILPLKARLDQEESPPEESAEEENGWADDPEMLRSPHSPSVNPLPSVSEGAPAMGCSPDAGEPELPPSPLPGTAHPASAQTPVASPVAGVSLPPDGSPRSGTILLVEDHFHNAKLVLTFLSRLGYQVTWVKDGGEMWQALERLLSEDPTRSLPSLILMDVNLPGSDGLALTRQIKQDDRYRAIPVIAQTAMAMKGDRALCLESGAENYISKPIDLDILAGLVAQYVVAKTP